MEHTKKRKHDNQNYDECPIGEFFWVGNRLIRLVERIYY